MTTYICINCGSTKWYFDEHRTSTERIFSSLEEGERYESESLGDNYDSDGTGPNCTECDSESLEEIDGFSDEEVEFLEECKSREDRGAAYIMFSAGKTVEKVEKVLNGEAEPKVEKPRKGKLIGELKPQ